MPVVNSKWVRKTLGACLAFSFSTLTTSTVLLPLPVHAHAEHGSESGVPTVSKKAKFPKGVSVQVVKTNAFQFALATDGKQKIEVSGEDSRSFLRLDKDRIYVDINSIGWHRAQQPGGGPIPDFLKENPNQDPKWVLLGKQPGYGWYDPRLLNEEVAHFDLAITVNDKPIKVRVERIEPEPMTGYWRPELTNEPEFNGLNALVPGLSGSVFMLSRMGTAQGEFQVLDDQQKPFIELRTDGVWLNSQHPWAVKTELFFVPGTPENPWVKVSETNSVSYSDPRLNEKPAKNTEIGKWRIPVKLKENDSISVLEGKVSWQKITPPTQ